MELGIKGHKTRGDEVVKILEMLGGKNCCYRLTGYNDKYFYYISYEYKYICNSYIGPDEIKGYKIFSLEDFLEKFPYKIGDKVEVLITENSLKVDCSGGRSHIEVAEIKSMIWNSGRCEIAYRLKDITGEFYKDDIKGKVNDDEEPQIDPSIDYHKVVENELYEDIEKRKIEITMDTLFRAGIALEHLKECGCELPDGYHFTDENGNVIDTTKIRLVKNTPSYPKTYKECCELLGCKSIIGFAGLDDEEENLYGKFIALKRCRDAYWKIAGEELGLDKPWEPVWDESEDLYTIHTFNGEIKLSGTAHRNAILVFPIEEMREAFYENFKDLIVLCKELL
jgi:hypothetical protein